MAFNRYGQPQGQSQISPFGDLPSINQPNGYRRVPGQGQPNIGQAIQGVGNGILNYATGNNGAIPFNGAIQTTGGGYPPQDPNSPNGLSAAQAIGRAAARNQGGQQPNALQNGAQGGMDLMSMLMSLGAGGAGSSIGGASSGEPGGIAGPKQNTQPVGSPVELPGQSGGQQGAQGAPTSDASSQQGSGSNVDKFMSMLNDPQYKGNAQAATDAFNKLGLDADHTGLSSKYGSSPAVYDGGNTIGLPDRYMTKNSDGSWSTTMRGPNSGGGSSQGGGGNELFSMLAGNPQLQDLGSQGDGSQSNQAQQGQDYATRLRQQIMSALQVNPQLAAIAQNFQI